ncbi:MAG TPA: ABC transporter substrate-binding protein, partial [Candidatus Binatus sp.]|nr:ABC transporter substrate-binding protein [Candidatus Binatus sp.]
QRNDTVVKSMVPMLASGTAQAPGWSVSPDGKTWTVTLRTGLTWHDGQPFDANDVKFTFDSIIGPNALKAPVASFYQGILGSNSSVTVVDPTHLKFQLPNPYAYFVENILGATAILPKHVLNTVAYANWRTDPFNAATNCATAPCPGPVGLGPYKWDHYVSSAQTAYLTRFDSYADFPVNGRPALQARGAFTVKNYAVKTLSGSDAAITDITTGVADVLDSQYHLETQQNFLSTWGSSKLAIYDAYGIQELAFNMQQPIIGTGVDTPLGKQDPSKAALAAQYVRQAISHAVPRQLIIDQLLYGYGKPGITSAVTPATDGFNTALIPDSFNLTLSRQLLQKAGYFPTTPTAPSFWDAYGVYLVGALVAAIVAISALFVFRIRRKPVLASSSSGMPPATTSPPPAPA